MVDADRESSRHSRRGWLAPALVFAFVAATITAGCSSGGNEPSVSTSGATACSATTVAGKLLPSVVTILVKNGSDAVSGSGEVIRSDGQILTNSHVIALAASGGTVNVLFSDGRHAPATITGRDAQTDIGVVKVTVDHSLPPIPFGTSSSVQVGEPVVALGAPLGLTSTVTSGIVSAVGRTVTMAGENGQSAVLLSAVQTDAAINPGNSGGALADCSGQMIGVPSAAASISNDPAAASTGSIGLGFAIPVDLAKAVSDELILHGSVTHSYFGMQVVLIPASSQTRPRWPCSP